MSLFTKLGQTINGSSDEQTDESDTSEETVERTGPNFMPGKQKELYLTAYANADHLSDTGVCDECGTTLSPFKAERLFASCKNEDCENHLREKEIVAVKRYEDRHGVPDEVESDDDSEESEADGDEDGSALDNLS